MRKRKFSSEAAYIAGMILMTVGTVFITKSDLGLSMVVAPAYLLHLKLVEYIPFFTFGTAGYTLQAVLIAALSLVLRKFNISYLFSFVTAVIRGFMLDAMLWTMESIIPDTILMRSLFFAFGLVVCAAGIAMMVRTYISPEAYDLFVKELSAAYGWPFSKCKTCYDLISCAVSIALSFAFFGFGKFVAINIGTIVCAFANGWLIGMFSKLFNKYLDFNIKFPKFAAWFKKPAPAKENV